MVDFSGDIETAIIISVYSKITSYKSVLVIHNFLLFYFFRIVVMIIGSD